MIRYYLQLLLVLLFASQLGAKPHVTSNIIGQLGNQMFQIAAATSIALDHDAEATFPELKSSRFANTDANRKFVFSRVSTAKPKKKTAFRYREPCFEYRQIPYKPNMKICGYFQSEKYFKHHRQEILELFAPLPQTEAILRKKYSEALDHPNSVAVHVRTYLPDCPRGNSFFIFLGWDYFERMIKTFPEDHLFIVCSDRIDLCKQHLSHIDREILFIDGNHYEDLYLMSFCKHNIISNSSFSWWAAWLNKNPNKIVVAPPKWFGAPQSEKNTTDVVPEEWIVYDY